MCFIFADCLQLRERGTGSTSGVGREGEHHHQEGGRRQAGGGKCPSLRWSHGPRAGPPGEGGKEGRVTYGTLGREEALCGAEEQAGSPVGLRPHSAVTFQGSHGQAPHCPRWGGVFFHFFKKGNNTRQDQVNHLDIASQYFSGQ